MNWNEVMVWGVSGVVIAAILAALYKKGKLGKTPAIILLLVLVIGGNALYAGLIKPRMQTSSQTAEIDHALAELPIFKTINEQEPELYQQIRSNILRLREEGKTQQEAIDTVKPMVSALISQRMNTAPDANVLAAMRVSLQEMQELQARHDGTCFKFLYPHISGGVNTAQVLSPELFKKDLDTMNDLLQASGRGQKTQPTTLSAERAQALMVPVREKLHQDYGDQLQMFNDLGAATVDRAKVCDISISLYSNILALPQADAVGLLRLMLGKQG
ncbi:hypothetical protein HX889_42850 [Pseudomonas reactans]|nr:hypothetical protein [Pseudomonas reactans]